jgi:hypothetical protein
MSSYKKLSKADVTTVPYHANKQWSLTYSATPNDNNTIYYVGKNEPFNITGSTTTNGEYQSLVFSSMNHLFYQSYSGSLLSTGSLMFNVNTYQSASQNRPTASYFDYNSNPLLIAEFPTASNNTIGVININQSVFGSKILPGTFNITSSNICIVDDGYGNLYDLQGAAFDDYIAVGYLLDAYFETGSSNNSITHIGNLFYAHGLAVITNQLAVYNTIFNSPATMSFKNEHIVYENEVRCIVKESEYNLSYNPTLTINYGSGSLKSFTTGSTFYPYATALGMYNDDNELLAVAKFGKPLMISPDTDMTFVIKYDT